MRTLIFTEVDLDIHEIVGLKDSIGNDAITEEIKSMLVVNGVCSESAIHDADVSWSISGGDGTTVSFRVEVYP